VTGASRDGDKRKSYEVALKLDTGSPQSLISSDLCNALGAQLLADNDKLAGAEKSPLEVEGAALIWLTWTSKDGQHRKELIYCLVVQVLAFHLIVSEDRDPNLFDNLRNARGEWLDPYGEIVAPVLDRLTRQERMDLDLKRQKILAEARGKQEAKDAAYAEPEQRKQEAKDAAYAEQRKHGT
jgi:hypothetical protein